MSEYRSALFSSEFYYDLPCLCSEQGRDISEKIALGLAKPTASKESMFDQRLYNQSAGIDSGFRGEDAYDVYDKPLFRGTAADSIYRPSLGQDSDKYGGGDADEIGQMLGNERFGAAGLGASRETTSGASVRLAVFRQRCSYSNRNTMALGTRRTGAV